jgi:hypothetical protein
VGQGGNVKTFTVQGSTDTAGRGINAKGAMTGSYADSSQVIHGFVGSLKSGLTSFDVPGSDRTGGSAVNDSGGIAGSYHENSSTYGFIRTP